MNTSMNQRGERNNLSNRNNVNDYGYKPLGANHIRLEEERQSEKVVSSPIYILQLCIYILYI